MALPQIARLQPHGQAVQGFRLNCRCAWTARKPDPAEIGPVDSMFPVCSHCKTRGPSMNGPAHAAPSDSNNAGETLEREVNEAIAICGGDMRAALKAALVANSFLAAEVEELTRVVSFGFTRGRHSPARRASEKLDEWREISSGREPEV